MAKTVSEQIGILNEKISKLEEQRKAIDSKIADAKAKKSVLEAKADLSYLENIKALGLSMEDLMNLAKENAKNVNQAENSNESNSVSVASDVARFNTISSTEINESHY